VSILVSNPENILQKWTMLNVISEEPEAVAMHSRSELGAGRSENLRFMVSIDREEIPRFARNRLRTLFDSAEHP